MWLRRMEAVIQGHRNDQNFGNTIHDKTLRKMDEINRLDNRLTQFLVEEYIHS